MADITEQLLRLTEEIELPKKGRTMRPNGVRLRYRLREGLRELRHGLFKDAEAVKEF